MPRRRVSLSHFVIRPDANELRVCEPRDRVVGARREVRPSHPFIAKRPIVVIFFVRHTRLLPREVRDLTFLAAGDAGFAIRLACYAPTEERFPGECRGRDIGRLNCIVSRGRLPN